MEFLKQGTGTEHVPHTDEDVRDSSSLPSSDGSDVTIRQISKFRMASSENNYHKEASLEEQLKRLKNSRRPTLGPNVAAIICEIWRYWAILGDIRKIFTIHGDIRRYQAISGDIRRY